MVSVTKPLLGSIPRPAGRRRQGGGVRAAGGRPPPPRPPTRAPARRPGAGRPRPPARPGPAARRSPSWSSTSPRRRARPAPTPGWAASRPARAAAAPWPGRGSGPGGWPRPRRRRRWSRPASTGPHTGTPGSGRSVRCRPPLDGHAADPGPVGIRDRPAVLDHEPPLGERHDQRGMVEVEGAATFQPRPHDLVEAPVAPHEPPAGAKRQPPELDPGRVTGHRRRLLAKDTVADAAQHGQGRGPGPAGPSGTALGNFRRDMAPSRT
jgi:hypothetical protein